MGEPRKKMKILPRWDGNSFYCPGCGLPIIRDGRLADRFCCHLLFVWSERTKSYIYCTSIVRNLINEITRSFLRADHGYIYISRSPRDTLFENKWPEVWLLYDRPRGDYYIGLDLNVVEDAAENEAYEDYGDGEYDDDGEDEYDDGEEEYDG